MSNSIDPDETAHDEPSHLDQCCLQKLIIIAYGSERVMLIRSSSVITLLGNKWLVVLLSVCFRLWSFFSSSLLM